MKKWLRQSDDQFVKSLLLFGVFVFGVRVVACWLDHLKCETISLTLDTITFYWLHNLELVTILVLFNIIASFDPSSQTHAIPLVILNNLIHVIPNFPASTTT